MKQHPLKHLLGYHGKHGERVYQCSECLRYEYAWTLEEAYRQHRLLIAELEFAGRKPVKEKKIVVREIVKLSCMEGNLPGIAVTKEENAYIRGHLPRNRPSHPQEENHSDNSL